MIDVYDCRPEYKNIKYTLRLVEQADCDDLLKVYSDAKSRPFFNSDNCYGDDFCYSSVEEMRKAIDFWIEKFRSKDFVRWTVIDNIGKEAVGTIELFHRDAGDAFTNCGLLRLDLRSDYETAERIEDILSLVIEPAFHLFACDKIATKAVPEAEKRICALRKMGFELSDKRLIGHDGTEYDNYFVLKRTIRAWEKPEPITKEDEDFFYNFLEKELRFYPSSEQSSCWLPFSLNRPFAVYDISKITDEQMVMLYEAVPSAFADCLQNGHMIYSCDWQHHLFLYDPRRPENCRGDREWWPGVNSEGMAIFGELFPDGDYCFHIDKYGAFGYLAHPWREEVWVFGEKLLSEIDSIHEKIGFEPKVVLN